MRKALGTNVGRKPAPLPGGPKPEDPHITAVPDAPASDLKASLTAYSSTASQEPISPDVGAASAIEPQAFSSPPSNVQPRKASLPKKTKKPSWLNVSVGRASGTGTVDDPRVRVDGVKMRSFTLHLPVDLIDEIDALRGKAPRNRVIEAMLRDCLERR